jgi:hypothetical protein
VGADSAKEARTLFEIFGFLEDVGGGVFLLMILPTYIHSENYQKVSTFALPPSFFPSPMLSHLNKLVTRWGGIALGRKSEIIKIIIMKARPNNITKTLLRAKSPPIASKPDPPPNKNP